MHFLGDATRVFCFFPSPATGQDRDAFKGCGPNFGFSPSVGAGQDLGFRICSLGFGMHLLGDAFLLGDAGCVFYLFPGPAIGQDRDALKVCGSNFGFSPVRGCWEGFGR